MTHRIERDRGEFAQRNIGIGAASGLTAHFDLANLADGVVEVRRQAHGHAELAIPFKDRGCDRAAYRGLDNRVHIPCVQTIPCRFGAIDLDVQVWLTKDMEYSEIFDPPDGLHLFHDLRCQRFSGRKIWSNDFDRVQRL